MATSGRRVPYRSSVPRSSDGVIDQSEATFEASVIDDDDLDALEPPTPLGSFRDAGEIRSHIRRLVELRQRQREAQERAQKAQALVQEVRVNVVGECLWMVRSLINHFEFGIR